MRLKSSIALVAAIVLAAAIASSAEAMTKRKTAGQQIGPVQRTVYRYTDDNGRRHTKIIVQRRSYLDAGTWVLPGQRKYNDYATQPFWSPTDVLGPGRTANERNPIGARWEFGGAQY